VVASAHPSFRFRICIRAFFGEETLSTSTDFLAHNTSNPLTFNHLLTTIQTTHPSQKCLVNLAAALQLPPGLSPLLPAQM
jgi:hypothetical protein